MFAPWAEGTDPRLWLYDTLFYARFGLIAWALAEVGVAFARRRAWQAFVAPVCAAAIGGLAWSYATTDTGLRFRTWASDAALAHSASLPHATPRHRAGHFLVDTVRMPCAGEAWLWLGRPFGGGTGTSRALVQAVGTIPGHPREGAYRFRHVRGTWWLAEQVAHAQATTRARCLD